MARLLQLVATVFFICSLATAAECQEGACASGQEEPDETSLVQVKQLMKPGNQRAEESYPADPEELVDPGSEWKAYQANKKKVEVPYEASAAHHRHFVEEQAHKRHDARLEAEKRLAANKKTLEKVYETDRQHVDAALKEHHQLERVAEDAVEAEKRRWEAVHAKKHKVEDAAIQGRIEGLNRGREEAAYKRTQAEEAYAKALELKHHAEELAAEARRADAQEDAVRKATREKVADYRKTGDRDDVHTRHWQRRADDKTLDAIHDIGSSDPAISHYADDEGDAYNKRRNADEGRIRHAVAAEWPELLEKDLVTDSTVPESEKRAFHNNRDKVQSRLEKGYDHRAAFEHKVAEERHDNAKAAADEVQKERLAMNRQMSKDREDVLSAAKHRARVEEHALEKLHKAKGKYEATAVEKHKVEEAAAAGRIAGRHAAAMHAEKKQVEAEEAEAKAAQARLRADEKAFEARKASDEEKALEAETKKKKEEGHAIVQRAKENRQAAEHQAADNTKHAVHSILGPELAITHHSEAHAREYKRMARHNEERKERFEHAKE